MTETSRHDSTPINGAAFLISQPCHFFFSLYPKAKSSGEAACLSTTVYKPNGQIMSLMKT
jgi:hypothetical protein